VAVASGLGLLFFALLLYYCLHDLLIWLTARPWLRAANGGLRSLWRRAQRM